MSFIIDGSNEGFEDNLALFTVPPVETGIQDVYVKDFRPVGVVSGRSVLEFDIPNNSSDYIMFYKARINLTLKINNDSGKSITNEDTVALINCPAASIFNQLDVSLQQKLITSSVGSNYPYKAILDILLESGVNDHLSWLAIGGFIKDTPNVMDDSCLKANSGLVDRNEFTKNGKIAKFTSNLFMDIASQKRLIINGVGINIKFYPARDEFRLMYEQYKDPPTSGDDDRCNKSSKYFTVEILDASLSIPFVKIHPGLITEHDKMIRKSPAVYPFIKSDIKAFNIPVNSYSWTGENIFQDLVPKRLVIALVSSAAYSGNSEKNPFNFAHYDLNHLSFQVNGQNAPGPPIEPNFEKNHVFSGYSTLFECMPPWQKEAPAIEFFDYPRGYTIYVLDLEKSKGLEFVNPVRRGNTRLSVRFQKSLPEPVTLLAYGTFDSLMNIDVARNVITQN